jgi:hypothetical protein
VEVGGGDPEHAEGLPLVAMSNTKNENEIW